MSLQEKKDLTFAELVSSIRQAHDRCIPANFADSVRKIQRVVLRREVLLNVAA